MEEAGLRRMAGAPVSNCDFCKLDKKNYPGELKEMVIKSVGRTAKLCPPHYNGMLYREEKRKLGRNDPCFCGSGFKLKKCCI